MTNGLVHHAKVEDSTSAQLNSCLKMAKDYGGVNVLIYRKCGEVCGYDAEGRGFESPLGQLASEQLSLLTQQ